MSYVELADIGKHWLQLNSLQQMYAVIFPILYGIMLNGCIGLELFHFGNLTEDNEKEYAWRRIGSSLVIINGLPIAFFACTFLGLGDIDTELNFFNIVGLFCISFSVFFFYRILHALFSCKDGNCFYSTCMRARMLKKREISFSIKGHLIGVLLYAIIAIIGFLLIGPENLFNVKSSYFFILLSILIIIFLWLLCAGPTENGSQPTDDKCKSEKKEEPCSREPECHPTEDARARTCALSQTQKLYLIVLICFFIATFFLVNPFLREKYWTNFFPEFVATVLGIIMALSLDVLVRPRS